MATRSTIWYYDEDKQLYRGVYCHRDGYLEGVGKILLESFNFEEGARAIVERGACSDLKPRLDPISDWHSFYTPEPGTSVFYHRDRDAPLEIYEVRSVRRIIVDHAQEYNYLWANQEWHLIDLEYFTRLYKLKDLFKKI